MRFRRSSRPQHDWISCGSRQAGSRKIDMSEILKVGVIYRGGRDQALEEIASDEDRWRFEYFEEGEIFGKPAALRADFQAVFFPYDDVPARSEILRSTFPAAEFIGYWNPARSDASVRGNGPIPILSLPEDLPLARLLLHKIAILCANRSEQAAMRGRADDLRVFFDAFINLMESSVNLNDRKPAMSSLLEKILSRLRAEECLIYLCGDAGFTMQRVYGTAHIRDIDIFEQQANSTILDRVLKSGMAYVDNDLSFEIRIPFSTESAWIRSIMCLPLTHRGQKIGVLEVLNKACGPFSDEDRIFMEKLVRPFGVAIHTIRMFDDAERLTITDDLTKLYNYRYLMQYLEAEVKRCLRYKKKVSLLFIDVDGFKRINDTYGHLVGSLALAEMGQVLRKIVRETDVVGRYGGDEFVIVLPETPLNGALIIAERIRKKVEDHEFFAKDLSIHLTVSLGIANCPKHTLIAEGLIKKADAAMYRAKELSKNSIKVAV